MRFASASVRLAAAAFAALVPVATWSQALPKPMPLKHSGPPTVAQITPADLMTRVYIFADDSMMGRAVGTEYNDKGTAYIEREVRRLGLQPAGDSGGYFQKVPIFARALDTSSTITVAGETFKAGVDFTANSAGRRAIPMTGLDVVYLGMLYDTTNVPSEAAVKGKIIVVRPFAPPPTFDQGKFVASEGFKAWFARVPLAAGVVNIRATPFPATTVQAVMNPAAPTFFGVAEARIAITVTPKVAELILGGAPAAVAVGTAGKPITSNIRFVDSPRPGRNVVAIVPGSDAKLKSQYVAIGAHNDHVNCQMGGGCRPPVEHDSLKAYMQVVMPQGADNAPVQPTPEQVARVKAITDSLRATYPPRPDTIYNGADDDASGSMAVLEIAEAFATARTKPKRSILFVWHAGEEMGLWGSEYFTDNPTVPRDSIVAGLNMDMVGRGSATDITGENKDGGFLRGGPGYVQLVGSRRLSTELGDLIERVNSEAKLGMKFDYGMDANGHPQNIYCRSDHWSYARYGIPITFLTTGGHADYHQVTDEPQYIEYDHLAQVSRLVYESALRLANLDHRVRVDKPKPDPKGQCVQ